MKKAKSDYLIQSVSRALDILEAFTSNEGELGVTELSRRLKLHKNNVFRLLATLETRGYVEQDRESGNYRLGMKTFEVANIFTHHLGIVRQARPALDQLAQTTGEAAYLGVLDGPAVVCVDMVDTSLHIDGAYRAPGTQAEVPFSVHTAVANGGLLDRSHAPPAPIHIDTGRESAHVTVRRQLAALFDGADFAKMKGDVLAGRMLQCFVDHLEVDIETGT